MSFVCDNTLVNLTGTFGPRKRIKLSNGTYSGGFHYGMDFAPEVKGTPLPVYAWKGGVVTSVGTRADAGRYVIVHVPSRGVWIRYCHLSAYSVRAGQGVQEAQYLGRMGATGNVTGVHLHFEVYTDAAMRNRVNPYSFIWNERNPMSFPINMKTGTLPTPKPVPAAPKPKPTPKPAPAPAKVKNTAGGADVRSLQTWLNRTFPVYSKLRVTGVYDAATQGVIKTFQQRVGTIGAADGNIGPLTKAALTHQGFKDWDGGRTTAAPKPAPKPAPAPAKKLVIGAKIRLRDNWAGFTYSNLTVKQKNSLPAGLYTVVGLSRGNIRLRGNGRDAWVDGDARTGLQ